MNITAANRIKGCLLGAAAGDALGRSVRKLTKEEILAHFGPGGIREYYPDPATGKALLSSDLQLTLFTADGILCAKETGRNEDRIRVIESACMDWYLTQNRSFESGSATPRHGMMGGVCWLLDVPELYSKRAHDPAGTVSAESAAAEGREAHTCSACSSVVRVIPAALCPEGRSASESSRECAEIAALTLQGTASKMCAAFLSALLRGLTDGKELPDAIGQAKEICSGIYTIHPQWSDIEGRIRAAEGLARCSGEDSAYLPLLGEGWLPEEALAVAVFCSLRHRKSLTEGILSAVNRTGDSCAAASETGAILGALLGADAIPPAWTDGLELAPVICELAEDLSGLCADEDRRKRKYLAAHRVD